MDQIDLCAKKEAAYRLAGTKKNQRPASFANNSTVAPFGDAK